MGVMVVSCSEQNEPVNGGGGAVSGGKHVDGCICLYSLGETDGSVGTYGDSDPILYSDMLEMGVKTCEQMKQSYLKELEAEVAESDEYTSVDVSCFNYYENNKQKPVDGCVCSYTLEDNLGNPDGPYPFAFTSSEMSEMGITGCEQLRQYYQQAMDEETAESDEYVSVGVSCTGYSLK